MHPAPPIEHAHAGHPTLRAIAEAVRAGRQVWSVKDVQDLFPGISQRLVYDISTARLESTAHSSVKDTPRPVRLITTRSIIAYFLETTSGLTQAEIIECMALMVRGGLSRKALVWLRDFISREIARLSALPEIHLTGDAAGQAVASPTPAARRLADAHPTLFDLGSLTADHTTATATTAPTPTTAAA